MIKDIVTDTELLSLPCEEATAQDAEIAQDLLDTMAAHENAVCLHANQIGTAKRIAAYIGEDDKPRVMFNPVIRKAMHANKVYEECLSLEGESSVRRFSWIEVAYQELSGDKLVSRKRVFQNWQAQIIQHMIDHGNGKLV